MKQAYIRSRVGSLIKTRLVKLQDRSKNEFMNTLEISETLTTEAR